MWFIARGSVVKSEGDYKISTWGAGPRILGEKAYVERGWILEGLAIGCHPLVPGDGLASFEDVFEVAIEPTLRRRARESPEWRFGVANLVFDEGEDEEDEKGGK